jgi:hypothetical protein
MSKRSVIKPTIYDYYLPNDEARAKKEAIINGAITCTNQHDLNPYITKPEIEESVRLTYKQVSAKPKHDIFTNDIDTLRTLTIHCFTESYLQTQALFRAHPQTFQTAKSYLQAFGLAGLTQYLADHIEALCKAQEVR